MSTESSAPPLKRSAKTSTAKTEAVTLILSFVITALGIVTTGGLVMRGFARIKDRSSHYRLPLSS